MCGDEINTGGGSATLGNVNARRDFIGRDKVHIGDTIVNFISVSDILNTRSLSPFMVPNLPVHGVWGRDDVLTDIYQKLLVGEENAENISPIALQGMGGIGKTTLATAFGRLEPILKIFPDGVLWVSVGPKPTIRILLDNWGKVLGINLSTERDEEACKERLRATLYYRRMLLIVDDIWEVNHGHHFNLAGPKCRMLLTTRETPVAYELAKRERTIRIDVLKPKYALELLRSLIPEIVAVDEKNSLRLCERLEFLPLAITLAGRFLAIEADVPSRMQRLLDELIERKDSRLKLSQSEFRPGLDERTPSLQAILGMSVERLNKMDQERFAMLSEFGAEPLTWELDAIAYVWECSEEEAGLTISHFVQRGLVVPRSNREYWMHALLVDYASQMLQELKL